MRILKIKITGSLAAGRADHYLTIARIRGEHEFEVMLWSPDRIDAQVQIPCDADDHTLWDMATRIHAHLEATKPTDHDIYQYLTQLQIFID